MSLEIRFDSLNGVIGVPFVCLGHFPVYSIKPPPFATCFNHNGRMVRAVRVHFRDRCDAVQGVSPETMSHIQITASCGLV